MSPSSAVFGASVVPLGASPALVGAGAGGDVASLLVLRDGHGLGRSRSRHGQREHRRAERENHVPVHYNVPPRGPLRPVVPSAGFIRQLYASCRTILLHLIGVKRRRRRGRSGGERCCKVGSARRARRPRPSSISTCCSSAPACRASAPPTISSRAAPAAPTSSSKGARRSAAPGTCSAIRASAPTATCTPWATASAPGRKPRRSPTGPSILRYVNDTADRYGIRRHIRFRHQVKRADWSSADARWIVEAERTDTRRAGPLQLQLAPHVQRLLQLCTRSTTRNSPARKASGAPSSTRNSGRRISTIRARRWW